MECIKVTLAIAISHGAKALAVYGVDTPGVAGRAGFRCCLTDVVFNVQFAMNVFEWVNLKLPYSAYVPRKIGEIWNNLPQGKSLRNPQNIHNIEFQLMKKKIYHMKNHCKPLLLMVWNFLRVRVFFSFDFFLFHRFLWVIEGFSILFTFDYNCLISRSDSVIKAYRLLLPSGVESKIYVMRIFDPLINCLKI